MNEIKSEKSKILQNLEFVCIEDVFDFDLKTLNIIKEEIQTIFKERNEISILINENYEDDDDEYQDGLIFNTNCQFSENLKIMKLKKLYPFILSEIKERAHYDEILNFFINNELNKQKITTRDEFGSLLDSKSKVDELPSNVQEYPNQQFLLNKENRESFSFTQITRDLYKDQQSFFLINSKVKPSIKRILAKTRLDDNVKIVVGQLKFNRNINTAKINRLPNLENKKNIFKEKEAYFTSDAFYIKKKENRNNSEEPIMSLKVRFNNECTLSSLEYSSKELLHCSDKTSSLMIKSSNFFSLIVGLIEMRLLIDFLMLS